jgi:hypothetical protein
VLFNPMLRAKPYQSLRRLSRTSYYQ